VVEEVVWETLGMHGHLHTAVTPALSPPSSPLLVLAETILNQHSEILAMNATLLETLAQPNYGVIQYPPTLDPATPTTKTSLKV